MSEPLSRESILAMLSGPAVISVEFHIVDSAKTNLTMLRLERGQYAKITVEKS